MHFMCHDQGGGMNFEVYMMCWSTASDHVSDRLKATVY